MAGRFFTRLPGAPESRPPVGEEVWGETTLLLGDLRGGGRYRDVLAGAGVGATAHPRGSGLALASLFARLPVALLERVG